MKKTSLKSLFNAFVKMDVAIFIFIFLTVGSVIGTIVQQSQPLETYQNVYGLFWSDILMILGFDNAYYSPWYLFFLALLMTSLTLCIAINGKVIYKAIFKPVSIESLAKLNKDAEKLEFNSVEAAEKYLLEHSFKQEDLDSYKKIQINRLNLKVVAYKNKALSKAGYFATHLGVLGLCIAGIVNGFFGFRADVDLIEGRETSKAIIYKSEDERYLVKLPFIIRNKDFSVERYSSNIVKEYITNIEILDKETKDVIYEHSLRVNSPLFINSFGLYQSSFYENVKTISFDVYNLENKDHVSYIAKLNEPVDVENTTLSVEILAFNKHTMLPSSKAKNRYVEEDFGPSIEYRVARDGVMESVFRTYKNYPDLLGIGFFDDKGQLNYQTMPVALENNDKEMLDLFADMLNEDNHSQFKKNIASYVKGLNKEDKIEYISKLIHAQKVYSELTTRLVVNITDIDYDEVSGIQVNYDPSARIFFVSSLLLCLGVIFMLYYRLKRVYVIQPEGKSVVIYII